MPPRKRHFCETEKLRKNAYRLVDNAQMFFCLSHELTWEKLCFSNILNMRNEMTPDMRHIELYNGHETTRTRVLLRIALTEDMNAAVNDRSCNLDHVQQEDAFEKLLC